MASDIELRKPHPVFQGFFQIEETDCYVNVHGRIWSEKNQSFLTPYYREIESPAERAYGSYPVVTLSNGEQRLVHILVATYFVEKPTNEKATLVNHIDGDKTNYSAVNLEWVTPSENLTHAFKTGLRTDNIPVLMKNLETGAVTRHYSMNECARILGINTSTLHLYMKREQTIPLMQVWDVVREGRPWNPIPSRNVGLERHGKDRLIIGVQKSTKTVYIFSSVARAVEHTGVAKHVIWHRLYRSTTPRERFCSPPMIEIDWDFFYHKDFEGGLENVVEILGQTKKRGSLDGHRPTKPRIPIEVRNVLTGEVKGYASSQEFCDEHGVKKGTFQNSVYRLGCWKNYEVKYLKPQPQTE